jgi:hypothetical protein
MPQTALGKTLFLAYIAICLGLITFFIADITRAYTSPDPPPLDPCVCAQTGVVYKPGKDGATHRVDCVAWETLETGARCYER